MNLPENSQKLNEICRRAGHFIRNEKAKVSTGDIELKSLNSLVSYVDKEAETMLVDELKTLVPEAGFITEEDTPNSKSERYNWIIDPLDGTTNYLHGIPVFAVSVALVEKDEPILACIYEIGQDEMFSAWKGGGAFLNGQKIKVNRPDGLADSLLATGFPYYDFGRLQKFLELLTILFQKSRGIRRLGSAATDLAYVACGRFDGFFEYGLHAWDVAAGILLVKEAGGKVGDFQSGDNYLYGKEIVAGSPVIFEEVMGLVGRFMR